MSEQPSIFDWLEAVKLRDQGMAQVISNSPDWSAQAVTVIESLPRGWEGLAERIREIVAERIGPPHHANCWGAVTNTAARRGLIRKTGEWKGAISKASHASMYPVWLRT